MHYLWLLTFVLHLIVAPQLSRGWQHNYSMKVRQAGRTDEQSMYSPMSVTCCLWVSVELKF